MREIPEEILFDTRLIDRHIAQGLITRKDVDEYMKKLADSETLSEKIDLDNLVPKKDGKGG